MTVILMAVAFVSLAGLLAYLAYCAGQERPLYVHRRCFDRSCGICRHWENQNKENDHV